MQFSLFETERGRMGRDLANAQYARVQACASSLKIVSSTHSIMIRHLILKKNFLIPFNLDLFIRAFCFLGDMNGLSVHRVTICFQIILKNYNIYIINRKLTTLVVLHTHTNFLIYFFSSCSHKSTGTFYIFNLFLTFRKKIVCSIQKHDTYFIYINSK